MFNHSVRKWVPEKFSEQELVQQFSDSVDWLLSVDYPYSNKLAYRFEAIKNKYANLQDVPLEDIYSILEETGYKYITDVLFLNELELRTFISFLNFIHIYKGSRRGLELVLRLLNTDFEIKEWWEDVPLKEPHTFEITLLKFNPDNVAGGFDIFTKLVNFTRKYIYPVLKRLHAEIDLNIGKVNFGSNNHITMHFEFNRIPIQNEYLIWDESNWDESNWE